MPVLRDDMSSFSRILARIRPARGPVRLRRLVQSATLVGFLWLLFRPGADGPRALAVAFSLDALVGVAASLAGRLASPALIWAGLILAATLLKPRVFCSHLCPMGTIIDLGDWLLARRRRPRDGWWCNLRYYVLAGVLVSAAAGVLLTGYLAPLPILARGLTAAGEPVRTASPRQPVAPPAPAGVAAIAVLAVLPALAVFGRRFWCRCLCPTGALFSLASPLHLRRRTVADTCISCGRCIQACHFGAVKADLSTRTDRCASCGTCEAACPRDSIRFARRWHGRLGHASQGRGQDAHATEIPPTRAAGPAPAGPPREVRVSRRGLLAGTLGGLALATEIGQVFGSQRTPAPVVRPPGSLPEDQFLSACTRCGLCVGVCPSRTLEPLSLRAGVDALWTPRADGDRAGCQIDCNRCGRVCPTGAIRRLSLEEKNAARMGLAEVDAANCLSHTGRRNCLLCVDACAATGRNAVDVMRVRDEMNEASPGAGLAPVVVAEKCVGCGLCQAACHRNNVRQEHLLSESAIIVRVEPDKEHPDKQDRIRSGSYLELRKAREDRGASQSAPAGGLPA